MSRCDFQVLHLSNAPTRLIWNPSDEGVLRDKEGNQGLRHRNLLRTQLIAIGTKSNPNLIFLENEADVPSYHRQCELCDKEEEAIDKS